MMTCKDVVDSYMATIKEAIHCNPTTNGRLAIVFPFLYPDHDNVEIFVRESQDYVMVSDLGQTLRRLDTIGLDFYASGRTAFQIERIAKGYSVEIRDGILCKSCTKESVGEAMSDVVSVCMAVADLAYGSRGYRPMTFNEEVSKFLTVNDFKSERNHIITGRFGTKYHVDFSVSEPKRVTHIQTLSSRTQAGSRKWVNQTYRMWNDIATNNIVVRRASVLSDESPIRPDDVKILETVSDVYRWKDRDRFMAALRAA